MTTTGPALCRVDVIAELFARCRSHADGTGVEWIEGWPGEAPPAERIWVYELDSSEDLEFFSMAPPLSYNDHFDLTLHFYSQTGGQSRPDAMRRVERYMSALLDVCRTDPRLGDMDSLVGLLPASVKGPFSAPNTKHRGFEGSGAVALKAITKIQ